MIRSCLISLLGELDFSENHLYDHTLTDTVSPSKNSRHSVIQGSFDHPCVMLFAGFSSGIVGRKNDTVPAPTWNLTITNASERECGAVVWITCQKEINPYDSDLVLLWKYVSGVTLHIWDGRVSFKKLSVWDLVFLNTYVSSFRVAG